jgi:hypothetical protein
VSLLSVVTALAKNVGMEVPASVSNSTTRKWVEALEMANEAGEELARRVDWSSLAKSTTLTGTGVNVAHSLPSGFDRLQRGITVWHATTGAVRPLTRHEWNSLTAVEGSPRYFLLEGNTITLFPYLANADTVTVYYQTEKWVEGNTKTGYDADGDVADFDENLLTMGLIARWRRQKGMPYQDFEAEYEAALQDYAGFDRRARY